MNTLDIAYIAEECGIEGAPAKITWSTLNRFAEAVADFVVKEMDKSISISGPYGFKPLTEDCKPKSGQYFLGIDAKGVTRYVCCIIEDEYAEVNTGFVVELVEWMPIPE